MSAIDVLREARARIEKPEAWMKGNYAANSAGMGVYAWTEEAVCFCALGAVISVRGDSDPVVGYLAAAIGSRRAAPRAAITTFNDSRSTTHADVLAAFDRAIQLASP